MRHRSLLKLALPLTLGLLPLWLVVHLAQSAPHISTTDARLTSWVVNVTGRLGMYQLTSGVTGTNLANLQQVRYISSNVYVNASGIPSYTVGPFDVNPNIPAAQNYVFRIPITPTTLTTHTATGLGQIAVLVNGVPVYNALDGYSWNNTLQQDRPSMGPNPGQNIWQRNALLAEGPSLDACGGHPAQGGRYHNHANPNCLRSELGDNGLQHSPILGWSFDGHPIYGPYGYAEALNANSPITRLVSGYQLRNLSVRQTLPDGTVLAANQYGPTVSAQYPLGWYLQDYAYSASNGDLDEYNGRFAVTPEYPEGIYAYFLTVDGAGDPAFPYFLGLTYHSLVASDNFGAGVVTVPAGAVTYAPAKVYLPFVVKP